MRYFPGSMCFLIAMTVNDEFMPQWRAAAESELRIFAHAFREQELFLDLNGCLDADVY